MTTGVRIFEESACDATQSKVRCTPRFNLSQSASSYDTHVCSASWYVACRLRHALSILVLCLIVKPGSGQFIFNPTIPGNAIIGINAVNKPSPTFLDQQALAISGKMTSPALSCIAWAQLGPGRLLVITWLECGAPDATANVMLSVLVLLKAWLETADAQSLPTAVLRLVTHIDPALSVAPKDLGMPWMEV